MKRNLRSTLGAGALAVLLLSPRVCMANVSGAIFTTVVDASIVNANTQYTSKCDVYLDGGPGANAPVGAAGLPAGDYFFQVTDPNGRTLLSTDSVQNRHFHVNANGVIDAYVGTGTEPPHPTGIDVPHAAAGAITIRMANSSCPADYLDTPNNGGVYKVWVTPVGSFVGDPTLVDNPCSGACSHGFVHSESKTDNFKVRPTTATFCLTIIKQLVSTGTISPGVGWPVHIMDSLGVTKDTFTGPDGSVQVCSIVAGTYTVSEDLVIGSKTYNVVGLQVNGISVPAQPTYSFFWNSGSPDPFVILFQNKLAATGPQ